MKYLKTFQILCLIVVTITVVNAEAEKATEKVSNDADTGVKEKRGLISGYTGETSHAVPTPAVVYGTPSNTQISSNAHLLKEYRVVIPQGSTSGVKTYSSLNKLGPVTFGVSNDLGSNDDYQGLLSSYVPSKTQISSVQAVPSYAVGSPGLSHYASASFSGIPATTYGVPSLSTINLHPKGTPSKIISYHEKQNYAPASGYVFDSTSNGNSFSGLNNLLSSGQSSYSITPSISLGLELPGTSEANFASLGSSYSGPSNTYLPAHSGSINLGSGGDLSYSTPLVISSGGKHSTLSSGGSSGSGLGYFTGDAGLSGGISGHKVEYHTGGISGGSTGLPINHNQGYSTGIISGANEGYSSEGLSLGNFGYSHGGISQDQGYSTGGISLGQGYATGGVPNNHGYSNGGISHGHGYSVGGLSHGFLGQGYSTGGLSHSQPGYLSEGISLSDSGYSSGAIGGFSGGSIGYQGVLGGNHGHSNVGYLGNGASGYNSYSTGSSQCGSGNGVSTTYGPPGYCPPNLIRIPSSPGYTQISSSSHSYPGISIGGGYKQSLGGHSGLHGFEASHLSFGKPATTYGPPSNVQKSYNTIRYSSSIPGKGYYP